jgi:hypothetical protein
MKGHYLYPRPARFLKPSRSQVTTLRLPVVKQDTELLA